jgi:hypothetical protein
LTLLSRLFVPAWLGHGLPQQFTRALASTTIIAAAIGATTLSGCSSSPPKAGTGPTAADPTTQPEDVLPPPKPKKSSNNGLLDDLFDDTPTWTEQRVSTLPPLPQPANLLPFDVSEHTQLDFNVDSKSLSVGQDGVIRLTVVITSPQGARNVYYEGIRCATFEWRLYAAANEDGTKWDRGVENAWSRMGRGGANSYQSTLYSDYLCANKMPAEHTAAAIVNNIKYHRAGSQDPH